jgi:methionyl-tRNA formyltransferase
VFLKTRAHAGVVVAYGRIFRPWALGLFPYGLLNIHPSLLPRHRGPSPVNGAILAGDRSTGITIMQLDQGMDTGDILLQEKVAIDPDETAGELEERLSHDAVDLLLRTLDQIEEGTAAPVPQDHARATLTGMLQKEDGRIDWTASAWEVHCRVRGTNPWPGARTLLGGRDLLLWRTAMAPDRSGPPGRLLIDGRRLFACAQTGSVELLTLQWPGKKPMDARSFLNGAHLSGKETLS